MTDLEALTELVHDQTCVAGANCHDPRKVHNMADPHWVAVAVIAAGWVPRCGDYSCIHADHADHAGGR
jgi:hypothetical protein